MINGNNDLCLHQQSSNCTDDEESIPSLLGDSDDDDNEDDLNIDLQSSPARIGPYVATNALSINIADQNCGHQTGSTSADCLPLQLWFFFDEAMTSRTRTFLPLLQYVFVDHVPILVGYFIGDKE
jgi:hypothetical protein